ncbi:MAG: cell envelope biogenesis protein OmpA, partial [Bacteroidota bacterium]
SPNPGSQATSTWSGIFTSKTQNDQELAYSQYAVPHRIVATASYRIEYIRHLASTFTIYYEGATQGTYSYIYNGDINNDGNSSDLMYIPKDPSEIKFTSLTVSGTTYTAQQQSDIFFKFIDQDKYLSKHKGQNAERNGALYPWYHRLDFNFQQDIFNNFGRQRNTLQFNLAIVNALNLLNKDWGIKKQYIVNNPLKVASVTAGTPSYQLATFNGAPITKTYINVNSTTTTWGIQLGLKYIF